MIYFEPDYVGEEYHLDHPRVLWGSATRRGVISATSEDAGFLAVNAGTATTADKWRPTSLPASWSLTLDANEQINAVAIDTHTLGSTGTTIAVEVSDGTAFETVLTITPDDDEPIAVLFEAREASIVRLAFTGAGIPQIGCIHVSYALEVPQLVYNGAPTPIDLAFETSFDTNQSAQGQYQGRSVLHTKTMNEITVTHLRECWVRETMLPFIKDAREYPYFLLERPFTQPTALSYKWRDSDVKPQRMGILDFMQVEL